MRKLILTLCIFCTLLFYSCYKTNNIELLPISPSIVPSIAPSPAIPSVVPSITPSIKPIEQIYAPVLYFDSNETCPLSSVESTLKLGIDLIAYNSFFNKQILEKNITQEKLSKYTNPKININGVDYDIALDFKSQKVDWSNEVYFNKLIKNNYTYIQYWFFYTFNDVSYTGANAPIKMCGNHEGDWEYVALKINNSLFQKATNNREYIRAIEEIYFSQHSREDKIDKKFYKPFDTSISFENTHLRVFVANGTHANYPSPSVGKGYYLRSILGITLYDIVDGKGKRIMTEDILVDLNKQKWISYGGRWGRISYDPCSIIEFFSSASNDGPYGPASGKNRIYYYESDWYDR